MKTRYLLPNDTLQSADGDQVAIVGLVFKTLDLPLAVYSLEVARTECYFVGEAQVLRILAYAQENDGELPGSLQELTDLGLIPTNEVDYVDPEMNARVVCQYRPVPTTQFPGDLIIMIQSYDPTPSVFGYKHCVLRLDGAVYSCSEVSELIKKDNQLRRTLGLAPIP